MAETLREQLNRIDHKCLDEGKPFYDLVSLFEAVLPKLNTQDKEKIKQLMQKTDDASVIAAAATGLGLNKTNTNNLSLKEDTEVDILDEIYSFLNDLGDYVSDQDKVEYVMDLFGIDREIAEKYVEDYLILSDEDDLYADEYNDVDDDYEECLQEGMNDSVIADLESIEKFLNQKGYSSYDVYGYDSYPMGTSKIDFKIDGDWKHDHWYFDELIHDWADENGRNIFKIDTQVIEDTGSDWYPAIHSVYVTKDNDSYDMLNSMRGLFGESLNEGNFRHFRKRNFSILHYISDITDTVYGDWTHGMWDKILTVDDDGENFTITIPFPDKGQVDRYYKRVAPKLKEIGAKKMTKDGSLFDSEGHVKFFLPISIQQKIQGDFETAENEKEDAYINSIWDIDISAYKPSEKILDKLRDYKRRNSKINTDAMKNLNKALTYLYGSIMIDMPSITQKRLEWTAKRLGADENLVNAIKEFAEKNVDESLDEGLLPDDVYNNLVRNAKETYTVGLYSSGVKDPQPGFHYEINTEHGVYTKVPDGEGFIARWFLQGMPQETVADMERVANSLINKYNCKEVSLDEYKQIVNESLNEDYGDDLLKRVRKIAKRDAMDFNDFFDADDVDFSSEDVYRFFTSLGYDYEKEVGNYVKFVEEGTPEDYRDYTAYSIIFTPKNNEDFGLGCIVCDMYGDIVCNYSNLLECVNESLEEDVSKNWKPNTSFSHIKQVLDKAEQRGKYVNNERDEVFAALDNCDKGKYTPEQRKFIRDSHEKLWKKNRKNISEDTVKQNGKWVNKGKEGTHGKFKTKKQADAQRKAMFANGYHEGLNEDAIKPAKYDIYDGPGRRVESNTNVARVVNGTRFIADSNFYGRRFLQKVILPNTVEVIDADAFGKCDSLRVINFPESLRKIDMDAFRGCVSLESITLPAHLEALAQRCFMGCTNLQIIEFPSANSDLFIADDAFYDCTSIRVVRTNQGSRVESYFRQYHPNVEIRYIDDSKISTEPPKRLLDDIIQETREFVQEIESKFNPSELKTTQKRSFYEFMEDNGFDYKNASTFVKTYSMLEKKFKGFSYVTVKIFLNSWTNGDSQHPHSVLEYGYYGASSWRGNKEIITEDYNTSDESYYVAKDEYADDIYGNQYPSLLDEEEINRLSYEWGVDLWSQVREATPEEIEELSQVNESLNEDAFVPAHYDVYGGSGKGIEYYSNIVKVANGVRCVGKYAGFAGNGQIQKVTLPNTVEMIDYDAFYKCANLRSINFPESLYWIHIDAFRGCISLESIKLPAHLTMLAKRCFCDCTNLYMVEFPSLNDGITIADDAFYGCSSLKIVRTNQGSKVEEYFRQYYPNVEIRYMDEDKIPTESPKKAVDGIIQETKELVQEIESKFSPSEIETTQKLSFDKFMLDNGFARCGYNRCVKRYSINKENGINAFDYINVFIDYDDWVDGTSQHIKSTIAYKYDNQYTSNEKVITEDYQDRKDEWGDPYSYDEVERELKSITNDWTDEDGTIRCYWEQEKTYGLQILKQHYNHVETSDGRTGRGEEMSWVIAYSKPKEIEEDFSFEDNASQLKNLMGQNQKLFNQMLDDTEEPKKKKKINKVRFLSRGGK